MSIQVTIDGEAAEEVKKATNETGEPAGEIVSEGLAARKWLRENQGMVYIKQGNKFVEVELQK